MLGIGLAARVNKNDNKTTVLVMGTILSVSLSFLAGIAMGYLFFWGLWKTVETMPMVKRPYLWMFGSFFIRMTILLSGFYLLLQIQWQLMAVALLGLIFGRLAVMRRSMNHSKIIKSE